MILHNDPSYIIYFGDKRDRCVKSNSDTTKQYLLKLKDDLKLKSLIFLNQSHTNSGFCVTDQNQAEQDFGMFKMDGDFLITNLRNVGIGVVTADCLPIVLYDPVKYVVCVIHAGWKGSVADIVDNAIDLMNEKFKVQPSNLIAYFGACAGACCYEVGPCFLKNLDHYNFAQDLLLNKNGIFFNLTELNKRLLLNRGVLLKNIHTQYNICTICSSGFHSYRGDNKTDYRQATIVALK